MSPRVEIRDPQEFGRVAVLLGGESAEREISLMSGTAVHQGLLERGVNAHPLDPRNGLDPLLNGEFDRVWIALHGRGGEDGTIQGLLESLSIPYTGTGVLGAALSMDKLRTKRLLAGWGLPTPRYRTMDSVDDCESTVAELGLPLMVKPALEGSSLGMTRVRAAGELGPAYETAAEYGCAVFAEAWVHGPEYTLSVLNDQALPLIRVDAQDSFYDYQAKYFSDDTQYHCPCGLAADLEASYAQQALEVFDAVEAQGWGRVDFMTDEQGQALFLEVNTVPGMTSHSLVPMAAAQAGINFEELVWRILETSCSATGGLHGA